jgi:hypothetical protein
MLWIWPSKYLSSALKGFLTCSKIILHVADGYTSHPKESVLRISTLKNPSSRPGLNQQTVGPIVSKRLQSLLVKTFISFTGMPTYLLDIAKSAIKSLESQYLLFHTVSRCLIFWDLLTASNLCGSQTNNHLLRLT